MRREPRFSMRSTRPRGGFYGRRPCRSDGPALTPRTTTGASSFPGPIPCAVRTGSRSLMRRIQERSCGAPSSRGNTQSPQHRPRRTVSSTSAVRVVGIRCSRSAKTTDMFSPANLGPAATRAHRRCPRLESSSRMRVIRHTVSRKRRSRRCGTTPRSAQAAAARQPSIPRGVSTPGITSAAWCSMRIRAPCSEPMNRRELASMRPQSTPSPSSQPSLPAL